MRARRLGRDAGGPWIAGLVCGGAGRPHKEASPRKERASCQRSHGLKHSPDVLWSVGVRRTTFAEVARGTIEVLEGGHRGQVFASIGENAAQERAPEDGLQFCRLVRGSAWGERAAGGGAGAGAERTAGGAVWPWGAVGSRRGVADRTVSLPERPSRPRSLTLLRLGHGPEDAPQDLAVRFWARRPGSLPLPPRGVAVTPWPGVVALRPSSPVRRGAVLGPRSQLTSCRSRMDRAGARTGIVTRLSVPSSGTKSPTVV